MGIKVGVGGLAHAQLFALMMMLFSENEFKFSYFFTAS
jgi:hypothetical protein